MVWIKRTVFSYGFKGRARRGLFWKKRVYKLWYEYAKNSTRKIPEEFGALSQFESFEDWWRHPDYGFELFCEPVEEPSVQKVSQIAEEEPGVIYLKVNLNDEPQRLKYFFSSILKKRQSKKKIEKKSKARFQPSSPSRAIKVEALSDYLDIWIWRNKEEYSREETYRKHHMKHYKNDLDYVDEDQLRYVSRACQRVRQIFKNIEKGTFP